MAHAYASMLVIWLLIMLQGSHNVEGRLLRGAARQLRAGAQSQAISLDGGTAASQSTATGDANVTTTSIALDGGKAVATQAADSGSHVKTVIAAGNTTLSLQQDEPAPNAPTWESAPDCPFAPTAANSKKDKSGRLWSWHNGASCAFRGPVYDLWDTAPACPDSLPWASGTDDKSGRHWGWHNNASCAFRPVKGSAVVNATGPERKLLTDSPLAAENKVKPGFSIASVQPAITERLAISKTQPIVASTTYTSGNSTVACSLVSLDNPDNSSVITQLKCEDAGGVDNVAALNSTTVLVPRTDGANTAANAASTSLYSPITPDNTAPTSTEDVTANIAAPPVLNALSANASMAPVLPLNASAETAVAVPTSPLLPGKGEHVTAHTVLNRFGITWEDAPVCLGKPTKRTAVQDTLGRLWWFEQGLSCAYRDISGASMYYDGYVQIKWETAPPCPDDATLVNSMADAEGRLWGWIATIDGANCKFVDGSGLPTLHESLLSAVIHLAAAESSELNEHGHNTP